MILEKEAVFKLWKRRGRRDAERYACAKVMLWYLVQFSVSSVIYRTMREMRL
jgi:hypothetical protein